MAAKRRKGGTRSRSGPKRVASLPLPQDDRPHIPVLLDEVISALSPQDGGLYIDGTFGAGGYTTAILEAADTRVLAIDRDPRALKIGAELAEKYSERLMIAEGRFAQMDQIAASLGIAQVTGVVLDIGVSSMQLDEGQRGFSFAKDGPLDMRMGQTGTSAADVVNSMEEAQLADVIYLLGEERRSRGVARAIVRRREETPFTTTLDLAEVIKRAVGGPPGRTHPATKSFQALRLYVNGELEELAHGLSAAESLIMPGGTLAVVTFHSLEDRIAKRFFHARSGRSAGASRFRPQTDAGPDPSFAARAGRAISAGDEELARNPRARSARLRSGQRTEAPPWSLELLGLGVPDIKTTFTVSD